MPKEPPSEHNRSVARRRSDDASTQAVAAEFGLSVKRINEIVYAVDQYDRGLGTWLSIRPALKGSISSARYRPWNNPCRGSGGLSLIDLIKMPNIGRRQATTLIDLYAELRPPAEPRRI